MNERASVQHPHLAECVHFMVDLETGGLTPGLHSIREIGAVAFVFSASEYGLSQIGMFDRYVPNPPGSMAAETVVWEQSQPPERAKHFSDRHQVAINDGVAWWQVWTDFSNWVEGFVTWPQDRRYFWSKPASFDWPFIDHHYRNVQKTPNPFSYRRVMDMVSFLHGTAWASGTTPPNLPSGKHTAYADAAHQYMMLADHLAQCRIPVRNIPDRA